MLKMASGSYMDAIFKLVAHEESEIWTSLPHSFTKEVLLNSYFNQSMVSSVAASLSCLQVQSTYCACICHQGHYWFCFMDYSCKNKGEVCWNVHPQTVSMS